MAISQAQAVATAASRQSGAHPQKYLRSESAFAVVGKAMRIYIRHLGVLLMTVAIPTLPFDILTLFGLKEGHRALAAVAGVASLLAVTFAFSAVCVVGSDICMGNKPSMLRAYRRIFGTPIAYVVVNSLLVFLCLCGVPLLMVFAIGAVVRATGSQGGVEDLLFIGTMLFALIVMPLVAIHLMYVPAISALEMKPGFRRALNRSSLLGRGHRIRSFCVVGMGGLLLTMALVTMLAAGIESNWYALYWNLSLHLLFFPLFAIASLLMYYDLRSRKEAFDFPCRDENIHD